MSVFMVIKNSMYRGLVMLLWGYLALFGYITCLLILAFSWMQ